MTSILLVEHNGNIKQTKAKDLSREVLYKKCGFRSTENFDKTTTWSIEHNKEIINIELWAKVEGKKKKKLLKKNPLALSIKHKRKRKQKQKQRTAISKMTSL